MKCCECEGCAGKATKETRWPPRRGIHEWGEGFRRVVGTELHTMGQLARETMTGIELE